MNRYFYRDLRFWLLTLAVALIVLGLFLPRAMLTRNAYDTLAIVDITSSMNTRDLTLNGKPVGRLDLIKDRLHSFMATLPCQSKFGLGIFSTRRVFILFEPIEVCANFASIDTAIKYLDWRMAWEGDSFVTLGVHDAITKADALGANPLFITDGHEAPPLHWSGMPQFDGEPGKVKGLLVGVGGKALGAAEAASLLYVTNQEGSSITVIDTVSDTNVATLIVAPGPAMIAASPNGRRLYVTHPEQGKLTILDSQTLGTPKVIDVSGTPFGVAAAPDGRIFVSDWNRNLVTVLDGATGAKVAEIPVGLAPAQVAVSPLNRRVFVANREDDSVSVIDTDRLTVIATVAVGRAPFALAVSPHDEQLYVANVQSSDLSVLSAATLEQLGTARVGAMPYGVAVAPNGERVLVANQQSGKVNVVDVPSLVVTHRERVGRYPENIVIQPDGSKAYVKASFCPVFAHYLPGLLR